MRHRAVTQLVNGFSILSTTMVHTHNPRAGTVEAELRASLNYIVNLRPAWAI